MRKSKFTDSQIMDAVKRVEAGFGVPDICREMGISTATFYKWRAKYGGMDVSMMSRMKELEEENRRLKKMYLEEKLKAEIVSEALEKKSGEAIPTQGDGHESNQRAWHLHPSGMPSL
jgi:putative transposase